MQLTLEHYLNADYVLLYTTHNKTRVLGKACRKVFEIHAGRHAHAWWCHAEHLVPELREQLPNAELLLTHLDVANAITGAWQRQRRSERGRRRPTEHDDRASRAEECRP